MRDENRRVSILCREHLLPRLELLIPGRRLSDARPVRVLGRDCRVGQKDAYRFVGGRHSQSVTSQGIVCKNHRISLG